MTDSRLTPKPLIHKHEEYPEHQWRKTESGDDDWLPVEKELPPNAKHKGALCPRYQLMTKYGITEGWYNPNMESWCVLCWFMTNRYLESEIDFERGTCPKVVRCENAVNDKHGIVIAWRPLILYKQQETLCDFRRY